MDTPCGLSQMHHAVSYGNNLGSCHASTLDFMAGGTPMNRSMSTSDLLRSGRLPGYGAAPFSAKPNPTRLTEVFEKVLSAFQRAACIL